MRWRKERKGTCVYKPGGDIGEEREDAGLQKSVMLRVKIRIYLRPGVLNDPLELS